MPRAKCPPLKRLTGLILWSKTGETTTGETVRWAAVVEQVARTKFIGACRSPQPWNRLLDAPHRTMSSMVTHGSVRSAQLGPVGTIDMVRLVVSTLPRVKTTEKLAVERLVCKRQERQYLTASARGTRTCRSPRCSMCAL